MHYACYRYDVEGIYRDDITCIIAMLPFLDDVDVELEGGNAHEDENDPNAPKGTTIQLNAGEAGISRAGSIAEPSDAVSEASVPAAADADTAPGQEEGAGEAAADDDESKEATFVARRLSVTHMTYDEDWDEEKADE